MFNSVEDILFWFFRCKTMRYEFFQKQYCVNDKLCSVDDIDIILSRLLLSGKLTNNHIKILIKYCEQNIIPSYIRNDYNDVVLWNDLISILKNVFVEKGFLNSSNNYDCFAMNDNIDDLKNVGNA